MDLSFLLEKSVGAPSAEEKAKVLEILKHPEVTQSINDQGITILHLLAAHFIEALEHPDVNNVRDINGRTPLDLAESFAESKEKKMLVTFRRAHLNHVGASNPSLDNV